MNPKFLDFLNRLGTGLLRAVDFLWAVIVFPATLLRRLSGHQPDVNHQPPLSGRQMSKLQLPIWAVCFLLPAFSAFSGTVAPATGGSAISADTTSAAGGSGVYTALTGPTYTESAAGQITTSGGTKTIVINAPTGFQFDTGTTPDIKVTAGDNTAGKNFDGLSVGSSANANSVTASSITWNVSSGTSGSGGTPNTLLWENIRVRPTTGTASTSGNMTVTLTGVTMNGVTSGTTSFGTLTEVAGAHTAFRITAASTTPTAGASDQLTITAVDQFQNIATTITGDHNFTFSGLNNALDGTVPTVTSKTGSAVNLGTAELITFTSGVSSAGGSLVAYKAETATLTASDSTSGKSTSGTGGTGVSVTVGAAAHNAFRITAASGTPTAGASDQVTITAVDQYQNTTTGVTGDHNFTFSGLNNALDGTVPTVTSKTGSAVNLGTAELITFASGVSSAGGSLVAYKAETATLTGSDSTSGKSTSGAGGTGVSLTIGAAAHNAFRITAASGTPTAGASDQLTITAVDQYRNTATGVTGDHNFTFSGLNNAPDGTVPTVTSKTGSAVNLGTAELITFTSGVSSAGSSLVAYKAETATLTGSDSTSGKSTSGTGGTGVSLTVSAAADNAYRITAASTTPTAGASDALTIKLVDQYQNLSSFSGDKNLTFGGLGNAPGGTVPTVTSKTGSAVNEGTATTITFSSGQNSAGGTLVAYKKEGPVTLATTDGTLSTSTTGGTGVSLTVSAATDSAYRIAAASTTPTAGASDALTIKLVDQYQNVSSFSGDKNLTFSGLGNAPGGTVPTVTSKTGSAVNEGTATTITFSSGQNSAGGTLVAYKAEGPVTLAATDGTISTSTTGGAGVSLTISAAADSAYRITAASTTPTAGASDALTIKLVDQYQNLSSFSGDKNLTFSGLGNSPSGTVPTVTSKTGSAVNEGTATTITFSSGQNSAGGSLVAYKAEGPVTLAATDGTLSTSTTGGAGVSLTVSAAADSAYRITAASTTPTAGASDVLTIKLVDQYQNLSSFSGDKSLTFSGLGNAPNSTVPTVTSKTGSAVNEGTATTITFSSGQNSAGGTLVAYKAEGPVTLATTDGTLSTSTTGGAGVSLTVSAATASQLAFTTQPSGAKANVAFTTQPVVRTQDAYGNLSTSGLASSKTVTIAIKTGTGTLTGTTTYDIGTSAGNGTITGSGLTIDLAGSKTLKATVSSGLSEGDSSSFTVDGPLIGTDPVSFSRSSGSSLRISTASLMASTNANVTTTDGGTASVTVVGTPAMSNATHYATTTLTGGFILYTAYTNNVNDSFTYTVSDSNGGTATGTVSVIVINTHGPTLTLTASGGAVTVSFFGTPNYTYVVERSTTSPSSGFSDLATNSAANNGLFTYTDHPGVSTAYYRVRLPN